jgi:hypothetical protein
VRLIKGIIEHLPTVTAKWIRTLRLNPNAKTLKAPVPQSQPWQHFIPVCCNLALAELLYALLKHLNVDSVNWHKGWLLADYAMIKVSRS